MLFIMMCGFCILKESLSLSRCCYGMADLEKMNTYCTCNREKKH